ncbi:MAG TPA: alpha/beta fold hydrolase [Crocinitomix sp.]|nr:alpha/beta fold hydrolase [Crocinitomix sp.]
MLKLLKLYFTILSQINPKLSSKQAFNLFQRVRIKKIREREKPFFEKAKHFTFKSNNDILDAYAFGKPTKNIVILIHGWDSNAGSLYGFVEKLLTQGKYVVGFNLPGHAFHKSYKTNLFHSKNVFKSFLESLPNYNSLSIISHSFGSAVTTYALSELNIKVNQLVFLTTPNHIIDIFEEFKKIIGLGDKAYQLLIEKTNNVLGEPITRLSIENKLKNCQYNHLHLIHDKYDKVIPFTNSENIYFKVKNTSIYPFENIGHYRMLWNDDVINQTIKCLSNPQ